MRIIFLYIVMLSSIFGACGQNNKEKDNKMMKFNKLTQAEENVIEHKATEHPFTGEYLNNEKVVVVMNGTTSDVELELDRYAETFGSSKGGFDIISNKNIELSNTLKLTPRQTIVLELN